MSGRHPLLENTTTLVPMRLKKESNRGKKITPKGEGAERQREHKRAKDSVKLAGLLKY